MTLFSPRDAFPVLVLAVGTTIFLRTAAAQTVEASPAGTEATRMVEASTRGRHLAPHDTFYLLSYVAARTSAGVEGFDPGQEVHLVEVRRATNTLVVSDGHAQVEVSPDQLTNDRDVAALARQKDEASQARIAAHLEGERAAYAKRQQEAADATARDLAQRRQAEHDQQAELAREERTPVAQTATPAPQTNGGDEYYGYGGFGYGSPYSYFVGPSGGVTNGNPVAAPAAPAAPAAGRVNPATVGTAGAAHPVH